MQIIKCASIEIIKYAYIEKMGLYIFAYEMWLHVTDNMVLITLCSMNSVFR